MKLINNIKNSLEESVLIRESILKQNLDFINTISSFLSTHLKEDYFTSIPVNPFLDDLINEKKLISKNLSNNLDNLLESNNPKYDPHSNLKQYFKLTNFKKEDLISSLTEFVTKNLSYEEKAKLYFDKDTPQTEKLKILTKLYAKVPFDYSMNAIKLASFMKEGKLPTLNNIIKEIEDDTKKQYNFNYLRTPLDVLKDNLEYNTGGDCFSTSFLNQILLSLHGIESKLVLCYDNPEDVNKPLKKHHTTLIAKIGEKKYYLDTSLNLEVPIEIKTSGESSGNASNLFNLKFTKNGESIGVSYKYKDKFRNLWYFQEEGNSLNEVIPSMLYILHPEIPPPENFDLNRNQIIRFNYFNSESNIRVQISYYPKENKYNLRIRDKQKIISSEDLEIYQKEGQIIKDDKTIDTLHKITKIPSNKIEEIIDSLNYINSNNLKENTKEEILSSTQQLRYAHAK